MSIRINQELNNIKNSLNNLNITGTDNTQAILTETTRAIDRENNILGTLLIEKKRAQYTESVNEQAIFSEATRAAAAEATVKTNSEAYADSLIANIDFSYINAYIENPSFDSAGKLLNDYSIVNKLYIDQIFQQLYNTLDT